MKRNNCIQNIKNQINAKINAHTKSQRDYIVFRPKSYLFNPILSRQNNNMTSIFQLENKRKNQTFLHKIRCKTKEIQQNSIEIDDHLHIQKCKTFKKLKQNKDKYQASLQPVKSQTPRQKLSKQQRQIWSSIKNSGSSRSSKKLKNHLSVLNGIQKKKRIDSLLLNEIKNNISIQQKQNISGSININRLRPSHPHEQMLELVQLNIFKQKSFDKDKIKVIMKRDKQTHKRLQTQIPAIFLMNFHEDKIINKSPLKQEQDYLSNIYNKRPKLKQQNYVFRPWETTQIFEKQQDFDEFFKTK